MSTAEAQAQTEHPAATAAMAIPWQGYRASREAWFRTDESFRWFQRQHLGELTEGGALALIGGRVFVVPEAFDAKVLEIGKRLAVRRAQ